MNNGWTAAFEIEEQLYTTIWQLTITLPRRYKKNCWYKTKPATV